jgi:metal-responsive CopG/Arc/MetJ family transcriptional regulator
VFCLSDHAHTGDALFNAIVDVETLSQFDQAIKGLGYINRGEWFRDKVRNELHGNPPKPDGNIDPLSDEKTRFTGWIEKNLMKEFYDVLKKRGYKNRTEWLKLRMGEDILRWKKSN